MFRIKRTTGVRCKNICYFYSNNAFDGLKDLKDVRGLTRGTSQTSDAKSPTEALPTGVGD